MARNDPVVAVHANAEPPFKGFIACSASPYCRCPGRLWLPGMQPGERVCVDHFATDPLRHEIANSDLGRSNAA